MQYEVHNITYEYLWSIFVKSFNLFLIKPTGKVAERETSQLSPEGNDQTYIKYKIIVLYSSISQYHEKKLV